MLATLQGIELVQACHNELGCHDPLAVEKGKGAGLGVDERQNGKYYLADCFHRTSMTIEIGKSTN